MKKVLKIVVDVLAWIILIAAFLVTVMIFSTTKNNGIASLFGVMPMSVQSDSMAPTFKTGDMILVKKIADVYNMDSEAVKLAIPAEDLKKDVAVSKAMDLVKETAVVK